MEIKDEYVSTEYGYISISIYEPDEKDTHKLAIICSGFLRSKKHRETVAFAEMFAEHGYTVITFDQVGVWESVGPLAYYSVKQGLADLRNVHDYIRSKKNYTHVVVCGHDIGGTIALHYASWNKISAVVSISPLIRMPLGLDEILEWKKKGSHLFKVNDPVHKERNVCFPLSYSFVESLLTNHNLFAEVNKIKCPTFLFASEFDNPGVRDSVLSLYRSVRSGDKAFVVIPGVSHNFFNAQVEMDRAVATIRRTLRTFYIK